MGSARLSAVFFLLSVFLKITFGQLFSLGNKQDCGPSNLVGLSDQGSQRLFNLISSTQAANFNSKPLSGFQQCQSCQRPNNQQLVNSQIGVNAQKPVSPNSQQSPSNSNSNQNDFYALPLSLQAKILQQIQQIQGASAPTNNGLQAAGQSSSCQPCEVLNSMPMINGQVSGLPSQVSEGVLLSSLGLTSSLPSLVSSACSCPKQTTDQAIVTAQNNGASVSSNVATSSCPSSEGFFSTKFIPISAIPMPNNYPTQPSYTLPAATNQQQNNIAQNIGVDQQNVPIQFAFHPAQQPVSAQSQQATYSQSQPVALSSPDPQALLSSYLLSQLGSSNLAPIAQYQTAPSGYQPAPGPSLQTPNQGQKSSSLKSLVPLILNMLKDKGGCGCPTNNNCGCKHENNSNKEVPQIHQGYSNQFSYGQFGQPNKGNFELKFEDTSNNAIVSKEDTTERPRNNKSAEEDYDDGDLDSYEDDDSTD